MGKIEEILIAIEPLSDLLFHDIVTYHVKDERFDVFRGPLNGDGWRILFHSEKNGVCAYFILFSHYPFIKNRKEYARRNAAVVFSMQNVFNFLDIQCPDFIKGDIDDLHKLSMIIRENFSRISDAFSEKNIETTYNDLITTTGNNENEINEILKTARGWN
jgi:hypothetical protein